MPVESKAWVPAGSMLAEQPAVHGGALRGQRLPAQAPAFHALFGGKRGAAPPPTMARMLHRNSISTMPIPALLNSLLNCSPAAQSPERLGRGRRAQHAAAMHGPSSAGRRTVSLKGSQLYTRKPELVPQAKHVTSWLKFTDSSSSDPALRESPLCPMLRGGSPLAHGGAARRDGQRGSSVQVFSLRRKACRENFSTAQDCSAARASGKQAQCGEVLYAGLKSAHSLSSLKRLLSGLPLGLPLCYIGHMQSPTPADFLSRADTYLLSKQSAALSERYPSRKNLHEAKGKDRILATAMGTEGEASTKAKAEQRVKGAQLHTCRAEQARALQPAPTPHSPPWQRRQKRSACAKQRARIKQWSPRRSGRRMRTKTTRTWCACARSLTVATPVSVSVQVVRESP